MAVAARRQEVARPIVMVGAMADGAHVQHRQLRATSLQAKLAAVVAAHKAEHVQERHAVVETIAHGAEAVGQQTVMAELRAKHVW